MSIQFSDIHNLVRTYQRILKVAPERPARTGGGERTEDRISLSREVRELRRPEEPVGPNPEPKDGGRP